MGAAHNPLSTRHVAPGAVPWFGDLEGLYERWTQLGRQAQIIGPHGTGKSTLLAHLVARAARDRIAVVALDDADVRSPLRARWARFRHRYLLITTHSDLGLPTLSRTRISLECARAVILHLLRAHPGFVPDDRDLERLLAAHDGNLREVLFALYDRIELSATRRPARE